MMWIFNETILSLKFICPDEYYFYFAVYLSNRCFVLVLGGTALVRCTTYSTVKNVTQLITLDYITDAVLYNRTTDATPYLTPDSRYVVLVNEYTGKVDINILTEKGRKIIFLVSHFKRILWKKNSWV